jgi:hypothetical protein
MKCMTSYPGIPRGPVLQGARAGGVELEILTVEYLGRCHICGAGWGKLP